MERYLEALNIWAVRVGKLLLVVAQVLMLDCAELSAGMRTLR